MYGVKTVLFYTYKLQNILFTISWPSPAQSQNCHFIRGNSTRSPVRKMYSRENNDFVKYFVLKTLLMVSGIGQKLSKVWVITQKKKFLAYQSWPKCSKKGGKKIWLLKSQPWHRFYSPKQFSWVNLSVLYHFYVFWDQKKNFPARNMTSLSESLTESLFWDS